MNTKEDARTVFGALLRSGGRLRLDGEKVIVTWNGPRDEALAARLRAAKPELCKMLQPLSDLATCAEITAELFNATKIEAEPEPTVPTSDDQWPLERRLAAIEQILAQRDARGRIAYARSQIESCRIGISSYAGDPRADAMLVRLDAAKKSALDWRSLAQRRSHS